MPTNVSDLLLRLQNKVLEAVLYGEPLEVVADILCRRAEELAPGAICSILTVDAAGRVHPLAGPSLPQAYSAALDNLPIGPSVGSCGTAAFLGEPVVVTSIATDPRWADFRDLALHWKLKACWSSPIKSRDGRVVGTFAFYHRTETPPNELEQRIAGACVHLCAIAIEHQEVQDRSYKLAYFDALTGLPNRGRFNEMLQFRISQAQPFGLLFLDLDHLKTVNDTMGHVFGDLFIKTLALRMQVSDPSVTACRLGGDEFALLVDGPLSDEDFIGIANVVLASASGMIEFEGQTASASMTIGGALFGTDGSDAETLCQNADFALYHAKETHRGGFVRFKSGLRTSILDKMNIVRSVDRALADGRMLPHYQPIVRLGTGEIVGLEALARMRTVDGHIMSAGQFQAALGNPRIAYQLTDAILSQVAFDIRKWLDAGLPLQHVGINVTTGDFQRGNLPDRIGETFGKAGVPLKHVILEVNEAVYMGGNDHQTARAVEALRRMGLLVALDDFGTGFASLTHLLSFPVDIIKIDKSFVDKLGTDAPSAVIVGGIIDIARKLNMRIVAEGIETLEQAKFLIDLGCTLGQGYLYSRACSADDAGKLMGSFAQQAPEEARSRAALRATS